MSWIMNPEGDRTERRNRPTQLPASNAQSGGSAPGTPTATGGNSPDTAPGSPWGNFPMDDKYPRVPDPAMANREVSTKQANRPFLAYAEFRKKKQEEHESWLRRKKEREEKIAKGEPVGPEEPDPTEEPEIGCLGLLRFLIYALIFLVLAGKFFTGSFVWESKLPNLRQFIPSDQTLYSERMLATFDGSVEGKPIYIAIDGDVFDVSSNRKTYGPGGSYHIFAGKDAARAYGTGCFKDHLTHDLRGLSEKELQGVQHWKKFFADHKTYRKVGRVSHPPIDPNSPILEHCNPKKAANAADGDAAREKAQGKKHRDEL